MMMIAEQEELYMRRLRKAGRQLASLSFEDDVLPWLLLEGVMFLFWRTADPGVWPAAYPDFNGWMWSGARGGWVFVIPTFTTAGVLLVRWFSPRMALPYLALLAAAVAVVFGQWPAVEQFCAGLSTMAMLTLMFLILLIPAAVLAVFGWPGY